MLDRKNLSTSDKANLIAEDLVTSTKAKLSEITKGKKVLQTERIRSKIENFGKELGPKAIGGAIAVYISTQNPKMPFKDDSPKDNANTRNEDPKERTGVIYPDLNKVIDNPAVADKASEKSKDIEKTPDAIGTEVGFKVRDFIVMPDQKPVGSPIQELSTEDKETVNIVDAVIEPDAIDLVGADETVKGFKFRNYIVKPPETRKDNPTQEPNLDTK
jgi:hypothetical protein